MLRKILDIPKSVEIEWSYPKPFFDVLKSESAFDWGIYQITTKIDSKDELLYIGKAWKDFYQRLNDHKKWIHKYDGDKYIRLGYSLTKITEIQLLNIENALILETQPVHNQKSKNSYTIEHDYTIKNTGFRGLVPKNLSTKKHQYY